MIQERLNRWRDAIKDSGLICLFEEIDEKRIRLITRLPWRNLYAIKIMMAKFGVYLIPETSLTFSAHDIPLQPIFSLTKDGYLLSETVQS